MIISKTTRKLRETFTAGQYRMESWFKVVVVKGVDRDGIIRTPTPEMIAETVAHFKMLNRLAYANTMDIEDIPAEYQQRNNPEWVNNCDFTPVNVWGNTPTQITKYGVDSVFADAPFTFEVNVFNQSTLIADVLELNNVSFAGLADEYAGKKARAEKSQAKQQSTGHAGNVTSTQQRINNAPPTTPPAQSAPQPPAPADRARWNPPVPAIMPTQVIKADGVTIPVVQWQSKKAKRVEQAKHHNEGNIAVQIKRIGLKSEEKNGNTVWWYELFGEYNGGVSKHHFYGARWNASRSDVPALVKTPLSKMDALYNEPFIQDVDGIMILKPRIAGENIFYNPVEFIHLSDYNNQIKAQGFYAPPPHAESGLNVSEQPPANGSEQPPPPHQVQDYNNPYGMTPPPPLDGLPQDVHSKVW